MTTILEIREKIKVYNKTINNFIKSMDIKIIDSYYVDKPNYFGDFRDYQKVSDEFSKILFSFEHEIREFERDYYEWKTPLDISNKTDIKLEQILTHMNKKDYFFLSQELNDENEWIYKNSNELKNKIITEKTKMKKISSYSIMRDIQIGTRIQMIRDKINNYC